MSAALRGGATEGSLRGRVAGGVGFAAGGVAAAGGGILNTCATLGNRIGDWMAR